MEPIKLEPTYSSSNVPGKCIICLAEEQLNHCLFKLLRGEGDKKELIQKFEILVSFLKSPESKRLRVESENYLAEGRQVSVRISVDNGIPKYKLEVTE